MASAVPVGSVVLVCRGPVGALCWTARVLIDAGGRGKLDPHDPGFADYVRRRAGGYRPNLPGER